MNDIQTLEAAQGITPVEVGGAARLALRLAQLIGRAVAASMFATLALFEPLVRFLLMSLTALGMFVTIVFGFLLGMEGFPRWSMLGFSGCCFLILAMYYLAMRAFANLGSHLM